MGPEISVLVSTSPIKSHPSTEKIDITIERIKERLPDSPIFIMADGVRPEQAHYAERYFEYLTRLKKKYPDIAILRAPAFMHQANMTKLTLPDIKTPLVFFNEHDLPICGEVPFKEMADIIMSGKADLIRLMHEAQILEPHMYLMLPEEEINGLTLTPTVQWSQRPHLARTDFYRSILDKYFSADSRTFIEDRMYGIVYTNFEVKGAEAWNDFKLYLYTPKEGSMKRLENVDGREDDKKYDENLIY